MNQRLIQGITHFIFLQDEPQPCDLILIPGTSKSAITEKAAELYHQGFAPRILPSGGFSSSLGHFARENIDNPRYDGDFETDFAYCKHILLTNGVPEQVILQEDRATNTMENAQLSARVIANSGLSVRRAIICCQAFHARRAFQSYACHFPTTELLVVPVDTQGICADDWYKCDKHFQKVMGEVAKCGGYFRDCRTHWTQSDGILAD